jgi:hypothetical protein
MPKKIDSGQPVHYSVRERTSVSGNLEEDDPDEVGRNESSRFAEDPSAFTLEQVRALVNTLMARLGVAPAPAETSSNDEELRSVHQRLVDAISGLNTPILDVQQVTTVRIEQQLVMRFLLENSIAFAEIPMCRVMPIFIYADKAPDDTLIRAWIGDMGFAQLDILRPVYGSWFGKFFATDGDVLTLEQFWDKHRRLHIAKDIVGSLGIIGATVTLAGTMISRPAVPVPTQSPTLQKQVVAQVPTTAPTTTVTINIYGLTNSIAGLVNTKTPEDALRIIERLERDAQKPDISKTAKKPAHQRSGKVKKARQ